MLDCFQTRPQEFTKDLVWFFDSRSVQGPGCFLFAALPTYCSAVWSVSLSLPHPTHISLFLGQEFSPRFRLFILALNHTIDSTAFYLRINLTQVQINLCQIQINLCQIQINLYQIQINLCQIQINICQIQINLCQIQISLCQIQINLCQIQINLCQIQINLYQIQINLNQVQINLR